VPKLNDLNLLKQALPIVGGMGLDAPVAAPQPKNRNYFLFMLGTDTVYTHLPTKDPKLPLKPTDYDNGETLSYMARVVAERLDETPEVNKNPKDPLSFSSTSVDVVNGPTTLGKEIGERISQGVFLILKALAEGKTDIQIAAHSRGAVESILITHELERIKDAINKFPNKSIFTILKESPCAYTKAAVTKLFKEVNESTEVRKALGEKLATAKINMLLMDPVPGGRFRMVYGTAWRDERFYKKPPCNSAELLICRDERSQCFKAIIPEGLTPLLIPGHHGTASGNLYSQRLAPVGPAITERNTATAQYLVVGKLLNFFNKHTNIFDGAVDKPIALQHTELDKITNAFLDPKQRSKQLLELYTNVHHNDPAFKYFSTTSYTGLLTESSSTKARMVHYGAHNSMSLDAVVSGLDGAFVNSEHVLWYLHEQMDFSLENNDDQPDVLIAKFSQVLNALFTSFKNKDERHIKISSLLGKEPDRKVTFQALSFLINTISQKYLRNHLTPGDKERLLNELNKTFRILDDFIDRRDAEAPINKLLIEFTTILHLGIKNTADIHYKSLKDRSDLLAKQLKYLLISNENFDKTVKNFLLELDKIQIKDSEPETLKALREVRDELGAIDPKTVNSVRTYFTQKFPALKDKPGGPQALDVLTKLLLSDAKGLEMYFAADAINEGDFLSQLDLLHENMVSIINGKDHIQRLVGGLPLEMDVDEMIQHQERIIKLAAEILIKKKVDLHTKPASLSSDFFAKVKPRAISLGADNPELADLNLRLLTQAVEIRGLKETAVHKDEQNRAELQRQIDLAATALKEATGALQRQKDALEQALNEQLTLAKTTSVQEQGKLQVIITGLREQLHALEQRSSQEINGLKAAAVHNATQYKEELQRQSQQVALALNEATGAFQRQKDALEQTLNAQLTLAKTTSAQEQDKLQVIITELREQLHTQAQQSSQDISVLKEAAVHIVTHYKNELERQSQQAALALSEATGALQRQKDALEQALNAQLTLVKTTSVQDQDKLQVIITGLREQLHTLEQQSSQEIHGLKVAAVHNATQYKDELQRQSQQAALALSEATGSLQRQKNALEEALNSQLTLAKTTSVQEQGKLQVIITGLREQLHTLEQQSSHEINDLKAAAVQNATQYKDELQRQSQQAALALSEATGALQRQNTALEQALKAQMALAKTTSMQEQGKLHVIITGLREQLHTLEQQSSHEINDLKAAAVHNATQYKEELQRQSQQAALALNKATGALQSQKAALDQALKAQLALAKTTSVQDQDKLQVIITGLREQLHTLEQQSSHEINVLKAAAVHNATQYKEELQRQSQQAALALSEATGAFQRQKDALQQALNKQLTLAKTTSAQEQEKLQEIITGLREQLHTLEQQSSHEINGLRAAAFTAATQYQEELQLQSSQAGIALQNAVQENEKQALLIKDISTTTYEEQAQKIKDLNKASKDQQNLIEQLSSSNEFTCANLIESKLIPMTQEYLLHLGKEAAKLNPAFTPNLITFSGKQEDSAKYEKVVIKYKAIEKLLANLSDTKASPLPSARIVKYAESLKTTHTQLKEHRDSDWMTYFRNSIIAIGVVCSGIIPGIIALLAYSTYQGKSPLFFTGSKGAQYIDKVEQAYQAYKGKSASFFAPCLPEAETLEEVLDKSSAAATAA
jgi:hypothetical protein